ncbi:MAG: hypothetical protein WC654_06060 [Patescibacteria group bacterium]
MGNTPPVYPDITSPNTKRVYHLKKLVGGTSAYRLYLCEQDGVEWDCLLQVAAVPLAEKGMDSSEALLRNNGALDRSAFLLRELLREAHRLETEFALLQEEGSDRFLNYDLSFPRLVDSFICNEQGKRRVNILAFKNVPEVIRMVPIDNIVTKNHLRVDIRTSAWILGKLLKLLTFVHSLGIAVELTDTTNILTEPDEHYILFFDWSRAKSYPDGVVPTEIRRREIMNVTRSVITLLGGNAEKRFFPNDGEPYFDAYTDHLLRLAHGSQANAQAAHAQFYELIRGLWKHGFHDFTTKPL